MARRRLWKQRNEQNIFGTGIRMRILLHKDTDGYVGWKYISFAEHVSNRRKFRGDKIQLHFYSDRHFPNQHDIVQFYILKRFISFRNTSL